MQYLEETVIKKLLPLIKENKINLIIGVSSIVALLASSIILLNLNKRTGDEKNEIVFNQKSASEEASLAEDETTIMVDLSGAVEKPGLYELRDGERLQDLLKKANGLSKSADRQFFERNFNLAKVLTDQEKIHIPNKEEVEDGLFKEVVFAVNSSVGGGVVAGSSTGANSQGTININTASESDLDKLPGIGPVTAAKIVASRPYKSIQDLVDNKIVNNSQWEKIKEMISAN